MELRTLPCRASLVRRGAGGRGRGRAALAAGNSGGREASVDHVKYSMAFHSAKTENPEMPDLYFRKP